MKIGLLGRGTVGKAVYEGLEYLGHTMSFYDPAYSESKIEHVLDTEIVFICVPTNQAENGDCDTSIVESVVQELANLNYAGLVCIKSTVIPGAIIRKFFDESITLDIKRRLVSIKVQDQVRITRTNRPPKIGRPTIIATKVEAQAGVLDVGAIKLEPV